MMGFLLSACSARELDAFRRPMIDTVRADRGQWSGSLSALGVSARRGQQVREGAPERFHD